MFGNVNSTYYGEKDHRTVRESVALRRRMIPINKTLSEAGTLEDLVNIKTGVNAPAYNLLLNPLMDATGPISTVQTWESYGGATLTGQLDASTVDGVSYTSSVGRGLVEITKTTADVGNFGGISQIINNPEPGRYAITARVMGDLETDTTGISYGMGIIVRNNTSDISDPEPGDSWVTTNSLSNVGQDISLVHTIPIGTEAVRIYIGLVGRFSFGASSSTQFVLANAVFVDAVQMEPDWGKVVGTIPSNEPSYESPVFTGYINPYADRYSRFITNRDSTNNFTSRTIREQQMQEIMYIHLKAYASETENVGGDVWIDFDRNADTNQGLYLPEGETFSQALLVSDRISWVNATESHTPIVRGYVIGQ